MRLCHVYCHGQFVLAPHYSFDGWHRQPPRAAVAPAGAAVAAVGAADAAAVAVYDVVAVAAAE